MEHSLERKKYNQVGIFVGTFLYKDFIFSANKNKSREASSQENYDDTNSGLAEYFCHINIHFKLGILALFS